MKEADFQSTRKEGRGSGSGVIKCSHPCGAQKIDGELPHNSCSRRREEADLPGMDGFHAVPDQIDKWDDVKIVPTSSGVPPRP